MTQIKQFSAMLLTLAITSSATAAPVAADSLGASPQTSPFNKPYRPQMLRAAQPTLGMPSLFGQWSDVESWPVIAVHAALLPNGKVLAWDATPDDLDDDPHTTDNYTTRVTLWDPVSNVHVPTNNDTNYDLFCAGSAHLWDGRVLFAGGDSGTNGANAPISNTSIYDPADNTWRSLPNMAAPRWYSSVAALANGEMLTVGGYFTPDPAAEVFQLDETWRSLALSTPGNYTPEYQWMQATPQGNVMIFGPQQSMATIATDSGQLNPLPNRDRFAERRYGSYAMYDIGKVLVSGGTEKDGGPTSYDSAVVVDTQSGTTTDTASMGIARTQHNLTILADGSVLASGGSDDGAKLISIEGGVYRPEIWSPDTGEWRYANDMQINRQYHSIALLLPDARVLSAGGGYCGDCLEVGYEEQNAEIFSPPYLFANGDTPAVRPAISGAPATVDYAQEFSVSSGQASQIGKVHLIKLGSVTHSQNQDQRLVPLTYRINGGQLQITAPASRNIAPPGHYMLFIVNNEGVPSNAHIMRIGQPLVQSGQTVVNSLRAAEVDEYVIQSSEQHQTLVVELSGLTTDVDVSIEGQSDDSSNTAQCARTANAAQAFDCRLANLRPTRWKISLTAGSETSYSLNAGLSNEIDETAIQPTIGSASGGGSLGFTLMILLLHAGGVRRSIRARLFVGGDPRAITQSTILRSTPLALTPFCHCRA